MGANTHSLTMWASILQEDCPNGDISANCLGLGETPITACVLSKDSGIFFGETLVQPLMDALKQPLSYTCHVHDGDPLTPGKLILTLSGSARAILQLERPLLNCLQHLSGVASITHQFVSALNNSAIAIVDTRKTTPLWRKWEKKAVVAGGGKNHRMNLSDMILIKENHIQSFAHLNNHQTLSDCIANAKARYPQHLLEIELDSPDRLQDWDLSAADIIMFDNFDFHAVQAASAYCRNRYPNTLLEVSGNVTLDTVCHYSELPIDRIAIGRLTHSVRALDMSLLVQ